jgi:hypothetical protein
MLLVPIADGEKKKAQGFCGDTIQYLHINSNRICIRWGHPFQLTGSPEAKCWIAFCLTRANLYGKNRAYNFHMKHGNKESFWYGFNITAIILIILFLLSIPLFTVWAQYQKTVSMSIETSSALVNGPATFFVEISNGEETPLNAVEFELHFDPEALLITSIVPEPALCEERFIITNKINHASGTLIFQCGTVTPFTGKEGRIATIYAIPLSLGTSSIAFASSTTHVLAHDGYGTDVTAERKDLIFTAI